MNMIHQPLPKHFNPEYNITEDGESSNGRGEYQLERYHRKRKEWIELLGSECAVCGTIDNLEIDHIVPENKSFNVSNNYESAIILTELEKCQLLCHSCHKEKHAAEHGTISRYRHHKCRCQPCKDAWSAACKRWKSKSIIGE